MLQSPRWGHEASSLQHTSTSDTDAFHHLPVLPDAVMASLAPQAGDRVLDATVGGAGHASRLLRAVGSDGFLFGCDRDPRAIQAASEQLTAVGENFKLFQGSFDQIDLWGLPPLQGILFDIGVSSPQLDHAERGFSFRAKGPLDMRMDPAGALTAADILQNMSEAELARIFFEFGEERHSRRLARAIVAERSHGRFWQDTAAFAAFVEQTLPRSREPIHPATRAFQALRIAVNDELGMLQRALPQAVRALAPGGRLGVISFHSLEDRIVKRFFQEQAKACVCPPRQPVCTCQKVSTLEVLTKKPLVAEPQELSENPRARSAKLRVARRLP
ncbi:MAG: 16S rRNA (cytosine(1402)-N(4))-methyltransferase RsmH [Candidatus Sericytochromatia bacterium]|nr:16S rRNA (cytosine(1402)-N(4))-methyltransferase RsmH [Candidatus Sericytochromatia bacterium]